MKEETHDLQPSIEHTPVTFLVVGLGNPGRGHKHNRHNVGFMVVDRLATQLGVEFTRLQLKAMVTDARFDGHRLILAKPQTYMNDSGRAAVPLARFYKIDLDHFLVVHDDLDIPLGTLRMRPEGGSGGQKGMRSIINHLGESSFPRLRIGVGRPPGQMDPADYLLQNFSSAEHEILNEVLDQAVQAVKTFIREGIQSAMTRFNRTIS